MIAVIDYGLNDTSQLAESLLSINTDFKITKNERDLFDCEKVIINDSPNISKAVKKIHLLNLFSLLRIQRKPILGISLGMELLCNKTDNGLACLGLIPTDIKEKTENEDIININSNWNSVHQIKSSVLFDEIPNDSKFYFNTNYYIEVVDATLATTGQERSTLQQLLKIIFMEFSSYLKVQEIAVCNF